MLTQTSWIPAARPMEHRWGERVKLDCPAKLVLPDGTLVEGRVLNASISGALIETEHRIPVYTTLGVRLMGTAGRRTLELPACLVRIAREGVAVEWRDMAVPTLVTLLREAGGSAATLCSRT
jgi:hypothetical protein